MLQDVDLQDSELLVPTGWTERRTAEAGPWCWPLVLARAPSAAGQEAWPWP